MKSSDLEKTGLGTNVSSDKSTDIENAGSDPEKQSGRDSIGIDPAHSGDHDGHDSDSTDAGEIQPVQSRTQSVINRVLSTVASTGSINPGPPPDGGLSAWVTGE